MKSVYDERTKLNAELVEFRRNNPRNSASVNGNSADIPSSPSSNSSTQYKDLCAQCKTAAIGYDPFVECTTCRRLYHETCSQMSKDGKRKIGKQDITW